MDTADAWHTRRTTLVDQHSYGVLGADLGLGVFETLLAADADGAVPRAGTFFDGPAGLALRRWCPPLLGLPAHCPPAHYLARRRELGAYAATRALLRGSGIGCFLLDTDARAAPDPFPDAHPLTPPHTLAAAAGGTARESVCLESLARQVADTSGSVRAFLANTAGALHAAAPGAAAFAVGAYFLEARAPDVREVGRAAERWLRARERARAARRAPPLLPGQQAHHGAELRDEPALLRHLVWSALVTRKPVQLRCPADPAPLEGFLDASRGAGGDVVLLPRRPHHASAARLAAAFPHTYADAGPSPEETLAQAPFTKLLFSSGTRTLPELYVVRARSFVRGLDAVLARWVGEGRCGPADAARVTEAMTHGTARRLYGLDAGVQPAAGAAGTARPSSD
ncbi:amidohydrolase [Streptomyces sp. HNM0574]|uniref:amidohydrolase n=1 Tax=Streptomyces sp. HNM0574 TaxID=2714954 RepID=UPI00146D55F7|nr:amidohydrolase [Streptomyces sp. HNM0574]NLU67497.1 amidohydrolase [Streptomyces sp. HNM0574]